MINKLIQLIFPKLCYLCNDFLVTGENFLCSNCLVELPYTYFWKEKDNPAAQVFWGRIQLEWVIPYLHFKKKGKVQLLIHQLKYKENEELGKYLGFQLGMILKNSINTKFDLIIPVPLHSTKLKIRGYNQSEVIAQGISEAMSIQIYNDILFRTKTTSSQTQKNRFDRWKNIQGSFEVLNHEKIQNKHVLLVDDVLTTGATIEACINELRKKANVTVSVATLAIADLI